MKTRLLLGFVVCGITSGFAAIPDQLGGLILHASGSWQRATSEWATVYRSDGTYSEIYRRGSLAPTQPRLAADLKAGTYLYEIRDGSTAVLTETDMAGVARQHTLHFDTDVAGETDEFIHFRLGRLEPAAPLANFSNRAFVRAGGSALAGCVITGAEGATILVRGIGPGLQPLGLQDFLAEPVLTVRSARSIYPLATNAGWSSESAAAISRAGALVGAFPLLAGSRDAAVLLSVSPGAYICEVASASPTDSGEVLIEVYVLP